MSHFDDILFSLARLLSYPTDETVQSSEWLYVLLMEDCPSGADAIAAFGHYAERHELYELEEAFTRTFDINPACSLEIGWHLFGEEYERGLFLVRMREELRQAKLPETSELPDHIGHALALIAAMNQDRAEEFVRCCVHPAVNRMAAALKSDAGPYRHVVQCLAIVLKHAFNLNDQHDPHEDRPGNNQGEVDLLHAFPVRLPEDSCCSSGCSPADLVPLTVTTDPEQGKQQSQDSSPRSEARHE